MALRFIYIISLVQVTLCFFACLMWSAQALSIVSGSAISLVNLWILTVSWLFIFYKKRVAPSISIVVIKYGILILVFSQIPKTEWINQNAFVLGILMNPVALMIGGIITKLTQKRTEDSNVV